METGEGVAQEHVNGAPAHADSTEGALANDMLALGNMEAPEGDTDPQPDFKPYADIGQDAAKQAQQQEPPQGQDQVQQQTQQQTQQQGQETQGDEDDFFLQEFDAGDGNPRDVSFTEIREALGRQAQFDVELANVHSQNQMLSRTLEALSEQSESYGVARELHQKMRSFLSDHAQGPQEPSLELLAQGPEGVQQYQKQRAQYDQYTKTRTEAQNLLQQQEAQMQQRSEALEAARREAVRPHFKSLWPEINDPNNKGQFEKFQQHFNLKPQDITGIRDPRMIAVYAAAYRHLQTSATGRKAANQAQRAKAPKIIRGKRQAATGATNRTVQSFVREGAGEHHLREAGADLLRYL